MGSAMFSILLPVALALVMFGLGLTLTVGDFTRVLKYPKAAVIALVCQMIVLPVICVGLIVLFGLEGVLAVGMMLLVASPGGTSANLFSHLAAWRRRPQRHAHGDQLGTGRVHPAARGRPVDGRIPRRRRLGRAPAA